MENSNEAPLLDNIPMLVQVRDPNFLAWKGDYDSTRYRLYDKAKRAVDKLKKLQKHRGQLYADCSFENYVIETSEQKSVVEKLLEYARCSGNYIAQGKSVILFGTKGTGKDHLLMALAKECVTWSCPEIGWVNGVDLYDILRKVAYGKLDYDDLRVDFRGIDVLWISDPIPPARTLTDYQMADLFGLVDARYSQKKPTWITMNAVMGSQVENALGSQIKDRLSHGSLSCLCDWPSYRTKD